MYGYGRGSVRRSRVWKRREKYVNKFAAGDGKKRRGVKLNWLTCLTVFVSWAFRAGREQVPSVVRSA